ncbi:MAG: ATP-binding cassette domain-containing protein [Bacteroidota bacterium]
MAELDTSGSAIWRRDGVSFSQGTSYLIEAPSGKGKTTLLAIILGIRKDYSGELSLDGKNIRKLTQKDWPEIRQKKLSCIFQGLELFDELTALENILLKNSLTRFLPEKTIREMAERTGIAPFLNKKTGLLSFGQRQRVTIIRALCQPFSFLLADECFSHIDDENAAEAFTLLKEACEKQGAGLLFTSLGHNSDMSFDQRLHL